MCEFHRCGHKAYSDVRRTSDTGPRLESCVRWLWQLLCPTTQSSSFVSSPGNNTLVNPNCVKSRMRIG